MLPAGSGKRSWIAFARSDGSEIGFNKDFVRSAKTYKAVITDPGDKTNWHPPNCNTIASDVTHEWGHQVSNYFRKLNKVAISKYVDDDGFGLVNGTFNKWFEQTEAPKYLADYPLSYGSADWTVKNESWAEGFSAIRHSDPTTQGNLYIKGMKNLITELDESKHIDIKEPGNIKYMYELKRGSAEWKRANEELDALADRLGVTREKVKGWND
jgi:hypothetical protein